MVIELRVVQFWCEIKLVITNHTPATRSCDFVITRLISHQIALHSVQLPLFIMIIFYQQIKTCQILIKRRLTGLTSLGPVYEFVCDSFRTGNLNCFRVK